MLLALVVFFVLLEAVFTALEVATGAITRSRLRNLSETEKDASPHQPTLVRRASRTLRILEDTPRLALTFIIVTSLSLWTATSLLTWLSLSQQWPAWALPVSLVAVLFVAEVLPVLIAAPRAEVLALRGGALLEGASTLLSPLIWLVGGAGRLIAMGLGAVREGTPQVTEDELRSALAAAEEEGAIESGERALLEGAIDFRAKVVREVMTSRMDIAGIPASASLHEVLQRAIDQGHSRLPVYDDTLDKIVGIVSTKDLLPYLCKGNGVQHTAGDIVRPAFYVPENKRIAPTLEDLRKQRTLMAIVVDDDGATAGLVTLEDLLEEIVGDIQDETDQEEPEWEVVSAGVLRCAANLTVREAERFWEKSFKETLALKNEEGDDADDTISLAALALHLFDGVPSIGDRVRAGELENSSAASSSFCVEMQVLAMSGPRIEQVKLERAESEPPAEGEPAAGKTDSQRSDGSRAEGKKAEGKKGDKRNMQMQRTSR